MTLPTRGVDSISGNLAGPSVYLSVITSTFSIKTLQIIPESRQTPHIIHHWKEDDISHDDDNDKDKDKDKDKDNEKDKDKNAENTQHMLYSLKIRGYKDIRYDILTT